MLCGGKRDHLRTCIPGSCRRCATWSGWFHRRTVGCRYNPTDGHWLHIGQRLSGNGTECITPVWAGWHQAREQLIIKRRQKSKAKSHAAFEIETTRVLCLSCCLLWRIKTFIERWMLIGASGSLSRRTILGAFNTFCIIFYRNRISTDSGHPQQPAPKPK